MNKRSVATSHTLRAAAVLAVVVVVSVVWVVYRTVEQAHVSGLTHRRREHTGKHLRAPTSNCHRWRGLTSVSIANRNTTVTEVENAHD